LMNVGLNLFTTQQLNSRVVEVVAEWLGIDCI
jgi:hypothetical protein